MADPDRYITPYGGRLEWRLPGGNKLIAHLKDKLHIRHRKRWSQVCILGAIVFVYFASVYLGETKMTYHK